MRVDVKGKTLDDVWRKANDALFFHDGAYDFIRPGVSVHAFHNTIQSESARCKMQLWQLGYTKTKWSMLLKLYFNPREYALFINRLFYYRSQKRGRKLVVDVGLSFNARENRLGACLLGFTIRFVESRGWECEVFSRASEVTSRWGVDLIFLYKLLQQTSDILNDIDSSLEWFTPKTIRVYWNSCSMFQSIITAPSYLAITGQDGFFDETPTEKMTRWQFENWRRWTTAFRHPDPQYQNYKSQARATKAVFMVKGYRPVDKFIATKDLVIPIASLEIEEDFFTRKGFR